MLASIIIPVYNRRNDLQECLSALPEPSLRANNSEIIVVDDGSTDGVGEMLASEFPHVRLVVTPGGQGPGCARNLGVQAAAGNLLIFLDSDAVPEPQWLGELLAHDDGHSLLAGRILDFHTLSPQYGPRRSTFIGKSLPCAPKRADMNPSCNLAVPRSCFEAVGGFREEISHAFEDSCFCLMAKRHGFPFKYLMNATVRHKGSVIRSGESIRATEHNGVYAMLTLYRHSWWRLAAFTLANGGWLVTRLCWWSLRGRTGDARLLAAGWYGGYKRFWTSR